MRDLKLNNGYSIEKFLTKNGWVENADGLTVFKTYKATKSDGHALRKKQPQEKVDCRLKRGADKFVAGKLEAIYGKEPTDNAYPNVVVLNVPYEEKDKAKELGAKWEQKGKFWYITKEEAKDNLANFKQWFISTGFIRRIK